MFDRINEIVTLDKEKSMKESKQKSKSNKSSSSLGVTPDSRQFSVYLLGSAGIFI